MRTQVGAKLYLTVFKNSHHYHFPFYIFNSGVCIQCGSYGCLLDLCIQLFVIMVGKQTIGNFLELGVP